MDVDAGVVDGQSGRDVLTDVASVTRCALGALVGALEAKVGIRGPWRRGGVRVSGRAGLRACVHAFQCKVLTASAAVRAVGTVLAEVLCVEESILGGSDGLATVLALPVAGGLASVGAKLPVAEVRGRGGHDQGQRRRKDKRQPHFLLRVGRLLMQHVHLRAVKWGRGAV